MPVTLPGDLGWLVTSEKWCGVSQLSDENLENNEPGPPMDALGGVAAAGVRLIVWCKSCWHQVEPDPCGAGPAIWCPDGQRELIPELKTISSG